MKKKVFGILLSLVMLISVIPIGVSAAVEWASKPDGVTGTGKAKDPYLIGTFAQLQAFADEVNEGNNFNDTYIRLIKDISEPLTTPIGGNNRDFNGHFDGAGHSVTIDIDSIDEMGLFGILWHSATVCNLTVFGIIRGCGLVDDFGGVCGLNYGIIENCVNAATVSGSVSTNAFGGVCGRNIGTVRNCSNVGKIIGDSKSKRFGGIVGYNFGNIENCVNSGEIVVSDSCFAGGVCGYIEASNGIIKNCFNCGTISTGERAYDFGGLCGYGYGVIENSFSDDSKSGTNGYGTGISHELVTADSDSSKSGDEQPLIDRLNQYIDNNPETTQGWAKWVKKTNSSRDSYYPVPDIFYIDIIADGGKVTADGSYPYNAGQKVSFSVLPDGNNGLKKITAVDDDGNDVAVDMETLSLSMPISDVTVTVEFSETLTVDYIDGSGNKQKQECKFINANSRVLDSGWYVVNSPVDIPQHENLTVNGTVNIILCDGSTLNIPAPDENNPGIDLGSETETGNVLNIYGQSKGTGKIVAYGGKNGAGIGGSDFADGGTLNIYGGEVETHGGAYGAGIGGGYSGSGGEVNIFGGKVRAYGGSEGGAGIGSGCYYVDSYRYDDDTGYYELYENATAGNISIYGGEVEAYGGSLSAGIGGGCGGDAGTIVISGGKVTARGDAVYCEGIGHGYSELIGDEFGSTGYLLVNGGSVTVCPKSEDEVIHVKLNGKEVDESPFTEETDITNWAYSGTIELLTEQIHVHNYTVSYIDNGDGTHSGKCSCGEVSTEKVNHTFTDGKCVCGAEDPNKPECEIISVTEINEPTVGAYTTLEFLIAKPVAKLQFVDKNGNTFTYDSTSKHTLSIVNNEDGTQSWQVEIMVYRQSDTYSLHVKNQNTGWSENYYEYTLADTHDYKAVVASCELPTEITEGSEVKAGMHDIVIRTSKDVVKVQLAYNGETATYTPSSARANVVEEDDCLVWTISQNFYVIGEGITYNVRTRTATTSFEDSGISFTVNVTKK